MTRQAAREELARRGWTQTSDRELFAILAYERVEADPSAIALLIDAGLPLDYVNGNGTPLIAIVAGHGHADLLRRVLQSGIAPDRRDLTYDMTPLMWAARRGAKESVELLIAAHADVNLQDRYGWTPLMFATAAEDGAIVRRLLAAGARRDVATTAGWSAPYLARLYHRPELTALVGSDVPPSAPGPETVTLRDLVVAPGTLSFHNVLPGEQRSLAVKLTLAAGRPPADVRLRTKPPFSVSPEETSLFAGSAKEIVIRFDAPVNAGPVGGKLAIEAAPSDFGSLPIEANVVVAPTPDAARDEALAGFVELPGDRASRREFFTAAVWQATRAGDENFLRALLAAGGDPEMVVDQSTPLLLACKNADEKTVEVLLRAGARTNFRTEAVDLLSHVRHLTPLQISRGGEGFPSNHAIVTLLVEAGERE